MKLKEEIKLRNIIRKILRETCPKTNRGWEGYDVDPHEANGDIDAGYAAAYHQQFEDAVAAADHLAEDETGGHNIITRHIPRAKK